MDELKALQALRTDVPEPETGPKEKLRAQLLSEMESPEWEDGARKSRLPRNLKLLFAGIILIGALALSPAGPAIADRLDGLLGLDDSGPAPTERDRAALKIMNGKLEEAQNGPRPEGTPLERRKMSSALMTAIAEETSLAAGGGPVSVTINSRFPLGNLNPEQAERLCDKIDRYLKSKRMPPDRYCDLEAKVQSGEIPPGTFSASQIDELVGPAD